MTTRTFDVELLPIEAIKPYPGNPRDNDDAVDAVAASLTEFGFRQPIVVDADGVIIVGHTRWKAAKKLGLAKVPVHIATDLPPEKVRAYRIADNQTATLAEWDMDLLPIELKDLQQADYDLSLLGFDDAELAKMLDCDVEQGLTDPDSIPAPPDEAISKRGEVYVLGDHRLMCGDSTNADDVARLMGGEKADLCFTSPPYGQQRDYTNECKEKCQDWDGLMRGVFGNLPMADAGQVLVNLGLIHRAGEWIPYWESWIDWMREQGWLRVGWYVWDQGAGLPGKWNGRYSPSHEFVFHFNRVSVEPKKFVKKKPENIRETSTSRSTMRRKDGTLKALSNPGASSQPNKIPDSVIRINRMHGGHGIDHPAIFPVELPAHVINSWQGVVYEPFCGSGTTIIAAEQLNRQCFGMEISPKYCDITRRRWAEFVHGEGCDWQAPTPAEVGA